MTCLDFAFLGRLGFPYRGDKMLVLKGLGTSGKNRGVPKTRNPTMTDPTSGGDGCLGKGLLGLPGQVWPFPSDVGFRLQPTPHDLCPHQRFQVAIRNRLKIDSKTTKQRLQIDSLRGVGGGGMSRGGWAVAENLRHYPYLHFLGKIAVHKVSGKTPGSPRQPSSRHP